MKTNPPPYFPDSKKAFLSIIVKNILLLTILLTFILIKNSRPWAVDSFGGVTIDEMIFHLRVPLDGTDTSVIDDYISSVCYPSIFQSIKILCILFLWQFLFYLERFLRKQLTETVGRQIILQISYSSQKNLCVPAYIFPKFSLRLCSLLISVALAIQIYGVCIDYSVPEYIHQQLHPSTWIAENYIQPSSALLTYPRTKRNLIYIFLESMESSYSSLDNGGAFEEDLIPELTNLSLQNTHFSNRYGKLGGATQVAGVSWTIAGMFAQTSGLPLKVPVDGNSMSDYSAFFPGVTSLGDLLHDAGYHNYLMIGSDATFGGRRNYFSQHGEYEIYDYPWADENQKIPDGYHVFWGFEDSRLLDMAKEKLLDIASQDEPFNFTMLTVDTHFPDGYRCELCQDEHNSDYEDALSCSSRQIYNFVEWIKQQDFYENTTIVISGDHLSMSAEMAEIISPDYKRTVYNCIINSSVTPIRSDNRTFTTMDMFPTTLAALGIKIDGDRLGLGTNLFSSRKTLSEEIGLSAFNEQIQMRSSFYNSLMY